MIIAQRVLTCRHGAADVTIPVSIYAPTAGDRCWECSFEIGWPEGATARVVRGIDGVQALYLAMQRVAMELYGSEYHRRGALRWTQPGQGYGFPAAKGGYDDLIGEDRISQV